MHDLKRKTVRAGIFNIGARGLGFIIRTLSIMIMARLLTPEDYGLVTMVAAFTGVLNMFGCFGLFQAAIQRDELSERESTSLFWLNLTFGAALALIVFAAAPMVSAFYREPRLIAITQVTALSFVITAAGVQHNVLLQRRMAFGILATIEIAALLIATAVSIGMAMHGYEYWAIVSMTISLPLATTIGLWLATGWLPGRPQIAARVPSMLQFGGGTMLNGFLFYITISIDKLLLGRVWGTEATGLYSRSFYLINFPTENLNTTFGEIAFAALSRTKDDPARFRRYFLKAYALVVALTLPLTVVCALFADDLIVVALGPKWIGAVEIFRILAPTILVFAINNPLGWLLTALGLVRRGVYMGLCSVCLMIAGVLIGLPHGPHGVAIAYSTVMVVRVIPATLWALHGTGIRVREVVGALASPLAASMVAAAAALWVHTLLPPTLSPVLRLALDVGSFGAAYVAALLLIAGEKALYLDLFRAAKSA
ncbi:MAG TPA: lipopolysaccharide biosynthesis protein [Bosea sp. (in: a-proteobacteria)]|jgi:PST family polysaccharide transporter|uniref:lipopolysaccharide biosynthesis protein n=1 Tax=Bosea sp. (in: a-proteobacteria) TaxID=1871050 RepID=UPI002E0F16CE|nr:lipopolysaccharide biosynthesis protein [Bosea sp. (in: a-proteobacteria)]